MNKVKCGRNSGGGVKCGRHAISARVHIFTGLGFDAMFVAKKPWREGFRARMHASRGREISIRALYSGRLMGDPLFRFVALTPFCFVGSVFACSRFLFLGIVSRKKSMKTIGCEAVASDPCGLSCNGICYGARRGPIFLACARPRARLRQL